MFILNKAQIKLFIKNREFENPPFNVDKSFIHFSKIERLRLIFYQIISHIVRTFADFEVLYPDDYLDIELLKKEVVLNEMKLK